MINQLSPVKLQKLTCWNDQFLSDEYFVAPAINIIGTAQTGETDAIAIGNGTQRVTASDDVPIS